MALNALLPGLVAVGSALYGALQGRGLLHRMWIRELEGRHRGEMAREGSGLELHIVRKGRVLRITGGSVWGVPELRTETPVRLPPGFCLGPPRSFGDDGLVTGDWRLDPHYDVRGGPLWWVRAMLADPVVQGRLAALAGERPPLRVRDGQIFRPVPGRPVDEFGVVLDSVEGLALALRDAAARTWAERALRPGLSNDAPYRLVGTVQGVPVRLGWEAGSPEGAVVLDATVPGRVPPDLRLSARRAGQPAGVPLRDLVLDRHVVATGASPERLQALICQDHVRGPLLALLHEAPGARVEGPRVRVRADGPTPDGVLASLEEAVDLAGALAGRVPGATVG
jgi:hypothetical protein